MEVTIIVDSIYLMSLGKTLDTIEEATKGYPDVKVIIRAE